MSTVLQEGVGGDLPRLFQGLSDEEYGDDSEDDVYYDSEDSNPDWKFDPPWNWKYQHATSLIRKRCMRTSDGRARKPVPNRLSMSARTRAALDYRMDLRRPGRYRSSGVFTGPSSEISSDGPPEVAAKEEEQQMSPCHNSIEVSSCGAAKQVAGNGEMSSDHPLDGGGPTTTQLTLAVDPNAPISCKVCNLTLLVRHEWHGSGSWENFETFRLAAAAGCQGCDTIADAVTVWLTHVNTERTCEQQLCLETCFVSLDTYYSSETLLDNSVTVAPQICLGWRGMSAVKFHAMLYVFRPQASDIVSRLKFARRYIPSGDTASPQAFSCLDNWLKVCTNRHDDCNNIVSQTLLPKRLLEITKERIYLREALSSPKKYACLSHCWGIKGVPIKLTEQSMESFKSGIPVPQLPKTFHDAVKICRRLGISYLWIDALCIIQDNIQDWEAEAAGMAEIYKNAFLTIAATASKDSNGGCFSDPNSPFRARKLSRSVLHVAEKPFSDYDIQNGFIRNNPGGGPLLERAWVYQERSLSVRIVHYTDTQLLWECRSMLKSESGDIDKDWTSGGYSIDRNTWSVAGIPFKYLIADSADAWHYIVQDYSHLEMTFPKDRLPALAAIVKSMLQERSGDEYIAGLWKSSLCADIMWKVFSARGERIPSHLTPTWSWASVDNPVYYLLVRMFALPVEIDVTYTSIGPPQLGNTMDATLLLRGRGCSGSVYLDQRGRLHISANLSHLPWHSSDEYWRMYPDYHLAADTEMIGEVDGVVVVFTHWEWHGSWNHGPSVRGLALRKISQGTYERVGVCETDFIEAGRPVRRNARFSDNIEWRYFRHFHASFPVQTFRII